MGLAGKANWAGKRPVFPLQVINIVRESLPLPALSTDDFATTFLAVGKPPRSWHGRPVIRPE